MSTDFPKIPTVLFKSNISEIINRLTNAFESLKHINPGYGISPDEAFVFDQDSFNLFVRKLCEQHFGSIYSKKGISRTFIRKVKGDFLNAVIDAVATNNTSQRLKVLADELKKL